MFFLSLSRNDEELRQILLRDFLFLKIDLDDLKDLDKLDAATKDYIMTKRGPAKKKFKRN